MDDLVRSIVLHADHAIRQLSADQQAEAVEALRSRMEERGRAQRAGVPTFGCNGKVRYQTKDDAERARGLHANAPRLQAYECRFCECWHLGHRRKS